MQEYFNISLEEYTMEEISALCGPKDAYVDLLCREFQTSFVMRGNELKIRKIDAESEGMVRLVVARLLELVAAQGNISERDVIYLCKLARIGQLERFDVHQTKAIGRTAQGKAIYPKTLGSAIYASAWSETISCSRPVSPGPERLIWPSLTR